VETPAMFWKASAGKNKRINRKISLATAGSQKPARKKGRFNYLKRPFLFVHRRDIYKDSF